MLIYADSKHIQVTGLTFSFFFMRQLYILLADGMPCAVVVFSVSVECDGDRAGAIKVLTWTIEWQ